MQIILKNQHQIYQLLIHQVLQNLKELELEQLTMDMQLLMILKLLHIQVLRMVKLLELQPEVLASITNDGGGGGQKHLKNHIMLEGLKFKNMK